MKNQIAVLCIFLFSFCGITFAEDFTLTIFHTNDTHGRGFSENGIGYGKIKSYIEKYRITNKNVLFFDAGDTFNGLPDIDLNEGKAAVEIMNLMNYDAFTLGNNDFVYGGQQVLDLKKQAKFPFLSANIYYKNKLAFEPYIIKKVNGVRIAIIGVSPIVSMLATSESKLVDFTVTNPIDEVAKLVPKLKKEADIILVLAHLGKTDPEINVLKLVESVPDIDIIVDSHDHVLLENGMKKGNTYIVNAGEYNNYLGVLDLQISNKKIISANAKTLKKEDFAKINSDSTIEAFIQKNKTVNEVYLNKVVAKSPFYIEGRREFVRSQESDLGSLLTDAEKEYTQADIALTMGAFLRDSIEEGEVTQGKILEVLPFQLPTVTRKMTGKQIVDFIEHTYTEIKMFTPAYTHVSGITYTVDFDKPVGSRMIDVKINGSPINLSKSYIVACNEQVSDYGIRDIPIEKVYDITMAQLLTNYLNEHKNLKTPEKRVFIKK